MSSFCCRKTIVRPNDAESAFDILKVPIWCQGYEHSAVLDGFAQCRYAAGLCWELCEWIDVKVTAIQLVDSAGTITFQAPAPAKLAPGYEDSFTRGAKVNARQLVLAQQLGRRDMRIMRIAENQYAVLNEFSLTDALVRHPLLLDARRSGAASDKRLIAEVEKTAAAMSVSLDRVRGPYSAWGDIEYWGD